MEAGAQVDEESSAAGETQKTSESQMKGEFKSKKELLEDFMREIVKNGIQVPQYKWEGNGKPRVLKVHINRDLLGGKPLPDPWMLMTKTAVNFSAIEYRAPLKLLPSCKFCPDETQVEYEEALHRWEMMRCDIPTSVSVPINPDAAEKYGESCVVTPP